MIKRNQYHHKNKLLLRMKLQRQVKRTLKQNKLKINYNNNNKPNNNN